ncbi:MAG: Uncharacterized protein G01um101438_950 [Parcubacteria group bacterium Gr01-1014_38]|nr:MAG: Uncharacterized protein G01um101438_950 [Parcubacteria group bacterium Gr01-1014_38]
MITAADLVPLRSAASDYAETERLRGRLQELRTQRASFFLTRDEFEQILRWKLRGQYGRQQTLRAVNTEDVVRAVTGLALTLTHEDPDYELELRFGILCALRGVSIPVASAILALTYPEEYAVIDFRGWRQMFGEQKNNFSLADYKRYVRAVRTLAEMLGWAAQETDAAIWEYDRRQTHS